MARKTGGVRTIRSVSLLRQADASGCWPALEPAGASASNGTFDIVVGSHFAVVDIPGQLQVPAGQLGGRYRAGYGREE